MLGGVKIYYINLARCVERRERIEIGLRDAGVGLQSFSQTVLIARRSVDAIRRAALERIL